MEEVIEVPQDRLQLLTEKRKWQTEIENKKRQLEDDKRTLQHLKSKALRERWLLDGAGAEQDDVRRQLEQDEDKTRKLEETVQRLENELISLETGGVCETITHTTVSSGSVKAVEVRGQKDRPSELEVKEVKVHKSPRMNKPQRVATDDEMKRAMYSVEITVERDRLTGETRVLSTNTKLPPDLSMGGVKVYEDSQKVVHEMNGEDGFQQLSSSQVDELIHKADESMMSYDASMMSQTVATGTSLPTEDEGEKTRQEEEPNVTMEIMGLETGTEPDQNQPDVGQASAEHPVTMVFMGYQNVEDEDETKKVMGVNGTVMAELVVIDSGNGMTSPDSERDVSVCGPGQSKVAVTEATSTANANANTTKTPSESTATPNAKASKKASKERSANPDAKTKERPVDGKGKETATEKESDPGAAAAMTVASSPSHAPASADQTSTKPPETPVNGESAVEVAKEKQP